MFHSCLHFKTILRKIGINCFGSRLLYLYNLLMLFACGVRFDSTEMCADYDLCICLFSCHETGEVEAKRLYRTCGKLMLPFYVTSAFV